MKLNFTKAEEAFFNESKLKNITTRLPYITVDSFPKLGLLSAISFLEWASENPDGVVSLPTGKTAQYFLQFSHLLLENWNTKKGKDILEKYGLKNVNKPELKNLQFVQMGEFYPINSEQHNSLCNFVEKNYIKGFGLDKEKALLIDSNSIALAENKSYSEVFPDFEIDLSLRYREAKSDLERLQQESI